MNQTLGPITLIVLVIPATALKIAICVLYGRRPLASADPMYTLLSMASNMMLVLAIIGATLGVWLVVIPLTIAVIATILMVLVRRRQAEHRALLGSLATAAQHGVPLSECARAYADETLGDTGVRAMALAEALERGEPLSTATRTARLWMSSATKLAVRMGEGLGLLGPAMRQQLDDNQQTDTMLRQTIGRFFYLWTVLVVLLAILSFVMLKIAPVLQKMFQEFNIKLPAVTNWLIDFGSQAHLLSGSAPIVLPALALLSVVGGIAALFAYVGWFPRDLPLVWRAFKRYDGALVMRGLALAVRRGTPLPQALRLVADCYPIRVIAGRLRACAERVSAGLDWRESLRWTGLITRSDAAVLAAAERVGNLDWALEEMADSALRRQLYWAQAALQVLFPLALLVVGFVVCMFVVGLFMPLVALIHGLYEQSM